MAQIPQLLYDGYQHQLRGQFDEAAHIYRKILRAEPNNADVLILLGLVRDSQFRHEEAIELFDKAIRIAPDSSQAHYNRGLAFTKLGRHAEAVPSFERAYSLRPTLLEGLSELANARRMVCDWRDYASLAQELSRAVRDGRVAISPFLMMLYSDDPAEQLTAARNFLALKELRPATPRRFSMPASFARERIRLAYLSPDFREHPVAFHLAPLIEHHDRNRFEVTAIALSRDEASPMRARLQAAFDHFLDATDLSNDAIAQAIAQRGIDILVDLAGFTKGHRFEVLARSPAPIHVEYFGYPGTTGANFIDYVIVDPFTVPLDREPFFTERLVHLPDSYQPNDRGPSVGVRTPSRAEINLPETGFVFCCMNTSSRYSPPTFEIWIRLLKAVPGSVLWLLADDTAVPNLRRQCEAGGIDHERLLFAPRRPRAEHLARLPCADLFLDTFPYTAHTSASDALWAGLPIITCCGISFQSRVAASLLHTLGLPELVTSSFEEYEALAFALATDPARLADLKKRLAHNRKTTPLFDIARYTRHLEAAYEEMVAIARRGEAPRPINVTPIAG